MKLLVLLILFPIMALAQKMPDMGLSKVRIIGVDETIVAEIDPAPNGLTVQSDKIYYWYSSNGIHSTEGGYSGKILNGLYTAYYLNKNLKEQGIFKNGLKTGVWKSWKESGKLSEELTWKNGMISGKFARYNEAGNLRQTGKYENNLMEGHSILYLSGDSTKVIKYKHGQINNTKDLTIWQRLYLAKKNTDTVEVDSKVKKDKKAENPNSSLHKVP